MRRVLRLPALAARHGPPVSLRHTERHRGVDPPGTARSLPVPLRALGSTLTHRVDVALLPPHPRLGRPAAPPERTRSSTRLAARSVDPGTFRRGLRGVTSYAHGREPPCLTSRRLPPPRTLRIPHVLGQGGGGLPGDCGRRAGRSQPCIPALLYGLLHHAHPRTAPRGRTLRDRPRRQKHPGRPLRRRRQARLLPDDYRDEREKRCRSL